MSLLVLFGTLGTVKAQDAAMPPDSMAMDGQMMRCPMMRMMHGNMEGGMMGMMMQRMTNDPVHRSVMQVYMLPSLDDALRLSADQAARLEDEQQQFARQRDRMHEGGMRHDGEMQHEDMHD